VRLGKSGPVLAVGRDLRVVAAMQQRLIQSQQEIERDYWRRQQSEIRNHDLIQNLTEAVLVVDSSTACVLDANAAALRLFGVSRQQIIGKTTVVNPDAEQRIVEASVEAPPGHPADARSQAAPLPPVPAQSAKPRANTISQASRAAAKMLGLVEQTTDGIVITDKDGDVVLINPGFAKLTKLGDKYLARDRPLGRWLSPARGEIETILREIRRTGVLAALPARLRDELGNTIEIEFSAAVLPGEDELSIGFIIRAGKAPKSPGQLRIAPPDSAIH
jgi:PAS domain-containing protein